MRELAVIESKAVSGGKEQPTYAELFAVGALFGGIWVSLFTGPALGLSLGQSALGGTLFGGTFFCYMEITSELLKQVLPPGRRKVLQPFSIESEN